MIVKNEEDWIEGAIESVRTLADEVIIVDTGCKDSTIDRIRRFDPKVLSFTWIGDFSAARNVSLDAATQPWIIVLDADERISPRDIPVLAAAIRKGADGFHLIQRNYISVSHVLGWTPNTGDYEEGKPYPGYVDNPLVRLFRNTPEIRFQHAVHEIVDPLSLPKFKFASLPVAIHHYGKVCERDRLAAKQRLYLELGLKKIRQEPLNAKAHFELGIQYQELSRNDEACASFDRAFQLRRMPFVLVYWAVSEKRRGNLGRAAELIQHASRLGLNTPEMYLELGNISLSTGDLKKAESAYRTCRRLQPSNPLAAFNLGLVHRKKGNLEEAERFYRLSLRLDPLFREASLELASLQMNAGRRIHALELLKSVLDREPECREARLGLAKHYIQDDQPPLALDVLGDLIEHDAVAQCLAGAAYLQQNDLDRAELYLDRALRRDRSLIDARINLAQVYTRKGDHAKAARFIITARQQVNAQEGVTL